MEQKEITFNDLPQVISQLVNKVESLEMTVRQHMTSSSVVKTENRHVPLTVKEACEYLKMPVATFYYKVERGEIPAIKQGKRYYIYRDELDRWLECGRKNAPSISLEEENANIMAAHHRKPNRRNW